MATKTLSKLKVEMVFNQDLTRLVDVMKGIAASQYQVMERKRSKMEKYGSSLEEFLKIYDFRFSHHPFIRSRSAKKLICLVTTDGGFLGGLNFKVIQAGMRYEDQESHYLVLGERGANYLKEFGKPHTGLPGINPDETRYELMEKVLAHIFKAVLKEGVGKVLMVYPKCLSFSGQRVEVLNLIPCPIFFKDKKENLDLEEQKRTIIAESKSREMIEYLTSLWLRYRLIDIFENSKMSEFGARTMHLEGSYQTLTKLNKQLKLDFFKARREKIDQSLRESFTAQLMCGE